MAKPASKRRVRLREGDLLELPLPDRRSGYGIIVKRGGLPSGGTPYIAIFRSAYDQRPDLSQACRDEVALQGWTTDAFVYHGRWRVIAHDLAVPPLFFPNYKVGMEGKTYVVDVEGKILDLANASELALLDYQCSSSASIFQKAFESLHGFGDWEDHFNKLTPAYIRSRVTRSTGSLH